MPNLRPRWRTVQIPAALVAKMDAFLERDGIYQSRPELVKAALLEWLEKRKPPPEIRADVPAAEVANA